MAGTDISGNNRVDGLVNEGGGVFRAAAPIALSAFSPWGLFAGDLHGHRWWPASTLRSSNRTPPTSGSLRFSRPWATDHSSRPTVGPPAPLSNDPYLGTGSIGGETAVSGHFTADGRLGVVVHVETRMNGHTYDASLEVLLDNGDGTFRGTPAIDLGDLEPNVLTVGNYGGDGLDDLAVVAENADHDFVVEVLAEQWQWRVSCRTCKSSSATSST